MDINQFDAIYGEDLADAVVTAATVLEAEDVDKEVVNFCLATVFYLKHRYPAQLDNLNLLAKLLSAEPSLLA